MIDSLKYINKSPGVRSLETYTSWNKVLRMFFLMCVEAASGDFHNFLGIDELFDDEEEEEGERTTTRQCSHWTLICNFRGCSITLAAMKHNFGRCRCPEWHC
jgi:hypothetical protein